MRAKLHPLIRTILAISPKSPEVITDFAKLRKPSAAADFIGGLLVAKSAPVRERRRFTIPVENGSIDLLVYWPSGEGPHPVHLFLHGGGWILGSIDTIWVERLAQTRCVQANCVVVCVNYRKAPEHKFPIPLDDCYAALSWVRDHAQELKADLARLTVGGQSAGGNLAAALCLKVRDEGGPAIAAQLLEVPALDMSMTSQSCKDNGTGYGLTAKDMLRMREYYLRSMDDITHPYASPLLAKDLSNLPPAFVMSSEFDPLLDDGPAYVKRLQEAGVKATYYFGRGHVHGSPAITRVLQAARDWQQALLEVLKRVNRTGAI